MRCRTTAPDLPLPGDISVELFARLGPRYLRREQRTQARPIECVNKDSMNCGRIFGAQRLPFFWHLCAPFEEEC